MEYVPGGATKKKANKPYGMFNFDSVPNLNCLYNMVKMKDTSTKKQLDAATKAKLEEVIKALFSQQDFHQVQMRSIAKKTGIGLNTIYLHYESKERLLFSFISDWIQALDDRVVEHLQGLEEVKERSGK